MDSSSRNRPYESCAAPGPSVNRGRKRGSPCAGEPDSREQSELPSRGQLCTPTRDQPRQCGTPQLAGSREGARQAPQRTTAPESSFHASSRGEQISSSPAAIPQAAPDPQVTNPHAGAQPSSSPSSAPATQATVPPLPYPWEEYWCTHYSLPFYYNKVSEERTWKRPESEGAEPASTPMQVRQDASAARAEEPASSSSNTVSPTITRTIHELRGTVIPFGTHVGRTVGWVMDTHPEFLWDFQRQADLWYGERVSICRVHSTIQKLQDIIAEDSRRQTVPQATAAACSHRACALTYQGSNNVSPEGSYWLCGDCGTRRFMPHTVGVVREPGLGTERSQTRRGALPRISLMMDTGCHRSVAGSEWHRLMQMRCSENTFSPRPRTIDERVSSSAEDKWESPSERGCTL